MKEMFKIAGMLNYIVVVFLNAFTDLGHKIIIQNTVFKVYDGSLQIVLTAIVNALVLLPYILMFSPSGYLADRFAKSKIMEYSALFAVIITLGITFSYYHGWFFTAFFMTFLLALQSAIYAPAKYGYIKELVGIKFISSGNAAVQATTTVAILSGIIVYTILFETTLQDRFQTKEDVLLVVAPLGWLLVIGSLIEWFLASKLPNKMLKPCERKFNFKQYIRGKYLHRNMTLIKRKREIFEAILALSLFWSISQVVLAVFGEYAKSEIGITNTIFVQGVMALAGIGIVIGSVMASNISKYYINTGLATVGSLGIMIIVFLVPFVKVMAIIAVMFTLFGIFAGFVMVPLNAYIQYLAPNVHLGTILAGNNFVQNIFMISFLVLTTVFAYFGMNAEVLFYLMGFVAAYMSYMLFRRYFIMSFWAFIELLFRLRYRYIYYGLENVPNDKAVLLLGNHVSWVDWLIIQFPLERRINFMMDKDIYNWKLFHRIFRLGEAIPVSPKASKDAFKDAKQRLDNGKIVAIYPEGEITKNGEVGKFYRGYELLAQNYDGVIIPFYIDGVFGSIFSRYKEGKKRPLFKRNVKVYFSEPVPNDIDPQELRNKIIELKNRYENKGEDV